MSARLILAPGKERSMHRRHPWLFAGAVKAIEGRARSGDTVDVVAGGKLLARAAYSPSSQIRARVWSFDPGRSIDDTFFRQRVAAAIERRRALPELAGEFAPGHGLRLIHGESDGLPGIVADRYDDTVVLQLNSAGGERWRTALVGALLRFADCRRIYERSDADTRRLEGLAARTGWLHGEAPAGEPIIEEHGIRMAVDIVGGHKTGFYLDQRANRHLLAGHVSGRRVLNGFCYTGGFTLHALAGGAREVLSIDSSAPALARAEANLALNPALDASRAHWRCANVFDELRALKAAGERFDVIVLDPPKFAPSVGHAKAAARAYKDINLLACRLLTPGGLLMTYSCSGGIDAVLFRRIVAEAACAAGRDARIVRQLAAGADHPIDLAFPEGEYLKGLLLQLD